MTRYVYDNDRVISLGRDEIRTSAEDITLDNLAVEMADSFSKHSSNRVEIDYLIQYFKGYQPYVLNRDKLVRDDVDNRIIVNYALSTTRDIVGYLLGKPIQFVPRDAGKSDSIQTFNEYLDYEDKGRGDFELAQYASICGTAYRGVFADPVDDGTPPFDLITLDPLNTYCVYSNDPSKRDPLYAVCYYTYEEDDTTWYAFSVYTKDTRFDFRTPSNGGDFQDMEQLSEKSHILGRVPIVEYKNNQWRMGDWETALSLLDSINVIASDSVNDVVQYVNSLLAVIGAELDEDTLASVKETKVINIFDVPPGVQTEVKYVGQVLDASTVTSLRDYLEASLRVILGVPDRKTRGGGGSDTGDAVFMRDGWMDIDLVASNKELFIIAAERRAIEIALGICHTKSLVNNLEPMDVEIKFSRSKSSNLMSKSQAYSTIIQTQTIAPSDALEMVDLTTDEQDVTTRGKAYWDKEAESNTQKAGLIAGTLNEGSDGDSTEGADDDARPDDRTDSAT